MISRQTSISKNIISFCRFLRTRGFNTGIDEEVQALRSFELIGFESSKWVFEALKAIFCHNKSQVDQFAFLYYEYWSKMNFAVDSKDKLHSVPSNRPKPMESFRSLKTWLYGIDADATDQIASYSPSKNFSNRDFLSLREDEIEEMMHCIRKLAKNLAARRTRRFQHSRAKGIFDLPRTLRANLRRGGELIDIRRRQPRTNRASLVVLCDVSRSMELYTAFFLQFIYTMQRAIRRVESFVFTTSLYRITDAIRLNGFARAKAELNNKLQCWSTGTRIGESLHEFVNLYGRTLLDRQTTVYVMSDGWDTADGDLLAESMQFIQARSKKVIWLNPLAGYHAYRPETFGMRTVLPHIDVLAPVHNLESLRQLEKWL